MITETNTYPDGTERVIDGLESVFYDRYTVLGAWIEKTLWTDPHEPQDARFIGRMRTEIQPCAIVEFGHRYIAAIGFGTWLYGHTARTGAFLHILDDDHGLDTAGLIALANAITQ